MFQVPPKILPALIVAIAAAVLNQPVFGGVPVPTSTPIITFTENASDSITTTYTDGFGATTPFTFISLPSGEWIFSTDLTTLTLNPGVLYWQEPENPNLANKVDFQNGAIIITSDIDLAGAAFLLNGAQTLAPVGTDTTNPSAPANVYAVFFDNAAASEVPDTGTTLSLFGLSLIGLAFLRRKIPA